MADEPQIHSPILELAEPAPGEVAIGGDLALKIRLACPEGCDLGGAPLAIEDGGGREVARVPPATDAIREVMVKAPDAVGPQRWSVKLAAQEHAGIRHEERTLVLAFKTKPHATSLAVWDLPSPVVMGAQFSVKVGAKSSASTPLGQRAIAISDASGEVVGRANLQDRPWPGTNALYWADVELPAQRQEGIAWFTASFAATDAEVPHDASATRFSVAVARPGEHRLSVAVFEKDTRAPVENAELRLGAYAAATDASGRAQLRLPKGSYELTVWKAGYDTPSRTLEISADLGVEVEATALPPENPYAPWGE
jgi:hypothetical protein